MEKRNKRLLRILEEADQHEEVRVSALAVKLQVSEMTVRKDLDFLCQENLLKRTYGGAIKFAEYFYKSYTQKDILVKPAGKMAVAKIAYQEIHKGDVVFMDGSSSCLYLTKRIRNNEHKPVTIVTNSILIANEVLEAPHVELILLGGRLQKTQAVTEGETVIEQTKKHRADICFLGTNGIHADEGITIVDYEQMRIKKAMMKNAAKTCFLADESKFGKTYISKVCDLKDAWKVILSCNGSREERELLKATLPDNIYVV